MDPVQEKFTDLVCLFREYAAACMGHLKSIVPIKPNKT